MGGQGTKRREKVRASWASVNAEAPEGKDQVKVLLLNTQLTNNEVENTTLAPPGGDLAFLLRRPPPSPMARVHFGLLLHGGAIQVPVRPGNYLPVFYI